MRIAHNLPALAAYNALNNTSNALQKTIHRLSTGLRINSASDDAAGLAISEKIRAQTAGLDVALRNTQDGVSLLQTAEGALSSEQSILQRMRELAVQAANDTLTANDRNYIQLEIGELKDEVNRIANTTQFNGRRLLDGSSGALWASSGLSAKALIHGGLDGAEGNYNIDITARPGQAQVQKSGICTIVAPEPETKEETVRTLTSSTVTTTRTRQVPGTPEAVDVEYYIDIGTGAGSVAGAENISLLTSGWSFSGNTLTITASGTYVIKGTTTTNNIVVADGVDAAIKLEDVNIDVSNTSKAAIKLNSGATARIYLAGNNVLHGGQKHAGIETTGATLVLDSVEGNGSESGSLTVTGGAAKVYAGVRLSDIYSGAGIGGGYGGAGGTIIINGGTIDATGGDDAAGIGGAWPGGGSGDITINGGKVTATASVGWHPAGIGPGCNGAVGNITIAGGKVLANGGSNGGAGIGGGGLSAVSGGTIKVRTGLCNPSDPTDDTYDVVANPGTGATGIGTGSRGGSVDVDLEADIPEPAYDPAPSLRLTAKSPTTPWEEVSYTETSLVYSFKDTARTVTISPNAFLNTLSEVELDESAGAKALNVNGLPGGDYAVKTLETTIPTPGSAVLTGTYGFETALPDILTVEAGAADGLEDLTNNANILFEVTAADATAGTVTLKATANLMGTDGTSQTRLVREGLVLSEGTAFALTGFDLSGTGLEPKAEEANPAVKLTLQPGQAGGFPVGSKFVYNFTAAALSADSRTVEISGTQESTELMKSPLRFTLSADDVKNRELHFSNFYLDKDTGDVHEGEVILTTNGNALDSNATLSSFRTDARAPEPLQRAAEPDTQLRELKTFYDSSGVFLLEAPQTLTITQGDGQTVDVTLYANDTLAEVRAKLNDAIADGLGQARYVSGDASHFVSFVEQGQARDNGPETVPGTFIVRSAVPGRAGELSFSGSQDILNALGLNTIQQSSESSYTASVYNAHTGSAIATNVKVTGNQLNGVIHKNVDVVFEPMSGITAAWNENTKAYALTGGQARLTLHLADRGMTFQTGANRGEELHVNIGAMSADALGIAGVSVATRGRAQNAIGMLDRAINRVSAQRAGIGAYQNSLEYTAENLTTAMTNLTAAESRIRDADMAQEMMELVKLQILNQSGTSMLAQANQLPQQVLSLIGG